MEPLFQHDCKTCVFLGSYKDHDLYFHRSPMECTVIARWSDEGQDYRSGMVFARPGTLLGEARARAIAAGLMTAFGR
jgi:hypothetical protein